MKKCKHCGIPPAFPSAVDEDYICLQCQTKYTTELKPCPFCGETKILDMGMIKGCGVSCPNDRCAAYMANIPIHKWNTRNNSELDTTQAALKLAGKAFTKIAMCYVEAESQRIARKALSDPVMKQVMEPNK